MKMKDMHQVIHEKLFLRDLFLKKFGDADGKIVLAYLMKISGIPKKEASTNAQELLVQEGKQMMVYTIFRIMNLDPQVLLEEIEKQYKQD